MSPMQPAVNDSELEDGNSAFQIINDEAVVRRSGNGILARFVWKMLNPIIFFGYSLILLCHFIGWVLFTIYAISCFLTQRSTTQRCKDFDVFSYPKELELSCWQGITGINAIAYILLIRKLRYADASSFSAKELFKTPKAFALLLVLTIAVAYEMMMISHEEAGSARAIEIGFIWRNVCVTSLVLFLNFTCPPREIKYKVHFFSTLLVFFLDQLIMASLMFCHVHFQINALGQTVRTGDFKGGMITVMTITGVLALHSSLLKFFWHKIFEGGKNLLRKGHI